MSLWEVVRRFRIERNENEQENKYTLKTSLLLSYVITICMVGKSPVGNSPVGKSPVGISPVTIIPYNGLQLLHNPTGGPQARSGRVWSGENSNRRVQKMASVFGLPALPSSSAHMFWNSCWVCSKGAERSDRGLTLSAWSGPCRPSSGTSEKAGLFVNLLQVLFQKDYMYNLQPQPEPMHIAI